MLPEASAQALKWTRGISVWKYSEVNSMGEINEWMNE